MISTIILALYAILVIIYLLICAFIIYHLARYATISEFKIIMLAFFIIVSLGLLASNMTIFFAINWENLITNFLR